MSNGTLLFVALLPAAVLYWMALRFPHDGRPFSRLRTCLSFLRLILSPSGSCTITLYEIWGHHVFSESNRFINMGYWRDASNLDDAGRRMAELLAEKARLKPGDLVIDVGFGFGDQDVLWMETCRPEKIIGLNITPSQVHSGRTFVDHKGLSHCIDLREGSATSMPLPDNSGDVILALECALHFETREAFFREAARVLRNEGRLALTDFVPDTQDSSLTRRLMAPVLRRFWQMPAANWYPGSIYLEKLEKAGFHDIRMESIRESVFPPLRAWIKEQLRDPKSLKKIHPLHRNRLSGAAYTALLTAGYPLPRMDYVIVTARRSGRARSEPRSCPGNGS